MGLKNKLTKSIASIQEEMLNNSDIISVLKKEHREVTQLFAEIEDCPADNNLRKEQLFNELKQNLNLHARIEENILYSIIKDKIKFKEDIRDSYSEHNQIRSHLDNILKTNVNNKEWMNILLSLKECVNHHVKDEENEIFPKVKNEFTEDQLESLGKSYLQEKERAVNSEYN